MEADKLQQLRPYQRKNASRPRPFYQRLTIRCVLSLSILAVLTTYDPLNVLPYCGTWVSSIIDRPLMAAATWFVTHALHVSGVAATQHPTDSRDTALGWSALFLVTLVSFLTALAWSLFDKNQDHDECFVIWCRYLLRFFLGLVMIRYGMFKIFPLQMSYPSLAVLNEPVGQSSPMTLLWTLVGLSPAYQITSGVLEVLSGTLLLAKRTALVGSMIGFTVMAHVTLLNLCFDVPVKLGALVITFALAVIMAPDASRIVAFFLRRSQVELTSSWGPMWRGKPRRIAWGLQSFFVTLIFYSFLPPAYSTARQEEANRRAPSPLIGGWTVTSAQTSRGGVAVDAPVLTAEGLPMTAVYFEPDGRAMARSSDGRLWRSGVTVDSHEHTVSLYSGYFDGVRFQATYSYSQPDKDHLRLDPAAAQTSTQSTLLLTRIAEPQDYPLLKTHFRWVQEWALER